MALDEPAAPATTKILGILNVISALLRYLRPYWLRVIEIALLIAVSVTFFVGLQKVQQILFDRALPGPAHEGDASLLGQIMALLAIAFVVVAIAALRENYATAVVTGRVLTDLRMRLFGKVQELHVGYFQDHRPGDITSRMIGDLEAMDDAISGAMAQGFRLTLTLVAATATVFWLDWRIGLFALVGMPLFFIAGRWLGPAGARAAFRRQSDLGESANSFHENLAAQPVVKAYGLEDRSSRDFRGAVEDLFRSSVRLTFISSLFGVSSNGIASGIQLSILGIGGWLVIQGEVTIGTLVALLGLLSLMIGPIQGLSVLVQSLQQAGGAMTRIDELLNEEPAVVEVPRARALKPFRDRVRFEGVTFAYDDGRPALDHVSMEIRAGEYVAIVGTSGSGKSTALSLLLRFYDPQEGCVTIDGMDIRRCTLRSVRSQMGVVFQEDFLFNTTIRENIRMGALHASDDDVVAAARSAEIHDTIMAMPRGYDTIVGERGTRLSGGQRQRIAIARAIVRNPPLLLLDEATSALDLPTEAAIRRTLDRIAAARTIVSVTHRLTSVVNCDRILVMQRGRIVEEGTHTELLARSGAYARLWSEQMETLSEELPKHDGIDTSGLLMRRDGSGLHVAPRPARQEQPPVIGGSQ
jgi:ATP-binding cassette, subfamily B, bacterial